MITRTMNLDEVEEEIVKDFPDLDKFRKRLSYYETKYINRKSLLRETMWRLLKLGINSTTLLTEKYTSDRNNQYIIAYALESLKDGHFSGRVETFVVIPRDSSRRMKNDYGILGCAPTIIGESEAMCLGAVITGHYINRVRERYPDSNKLSLYDILLDIPENPSVLASVDTNVIKARNLQELEAISTINQENRQDVKTRALGYCSASTFTTEGYPDLTRPIFRTFKLTLSSTQENRILCIKKMQRDLINGDTTLIKKDKLKELKENG